MVYFTSLAGFSPPSYLSAYLIEHMIFRQAELSDIPQLMRVRFSVKENILSNPGLVTEKDCEKYLVKRGRGWVCEIDRVVIGFAIVDLAANNVWALFIQPGFDGKGIGKRLHRDMLDWYFNQTNITLWLGTAPGTRAELFYRRAGWTDMGLRPNGEIRFEMTAGDWKNRIFL